MLEKTNHKIAPKEVVNALLTLYRQGRFDDILSRSSQLIKEYPQTFILHNIMGEISFEKGHIEVAIEHFHKVIELHPHDPHGYNNLGAALINISNYQEAKSNLEKAIKLKPDYAEAYNNMGIILKDQGKYEKAIEAYNKALSIKPDYAEVYWNLHGISKSISEAKKWIKQCLKVDPDHLKAKLTISALQFYEGNKSEFNKLLKSTLKEHPYIRSFAWAFSLPELPLLHFDRWALFDQMIKMSDKDRPFYEFGVWRGEAFKYLIKTFKKGYGFDTFEGLPEDWHNVKAGTYSSDGNIPKVDGGEFIVGKFEDTLPSFFAETRPMASIINFDADLYSSTICALNFAKPVIDKHTILIFDEFIINQDWEKDEYKALEEFCAKNHFTYEVIAISFFTKQVAVRLFGI